MIAKAAISLFEIQNLNGLHIRDDCIIQTKNYEKAPVGCCVIDSFVHGQTHTVDHDKHQNVVKLYI
jgi:hypothetical protein